jgi:hypothetical protein
MACRILEEHGDVTDVSYELPNKHYIPVDMKYIGIDNQTPLSIVLLHHRMNSLFVPLGFELLTDRLARLDRMLRCLSRSQPRGACVY